VSSETSAIRTQTPGNYPKEQITYWGLKAVGLDHSVWQCRFGRSFGPAVRQFYDYDDDDK